MAQRPQDSTLDSWRYFNRECTSFVAWRLHSRNHYEMPPALGDAGQWGSYFAPRGVVVNNVPAVGAIAESAGHLAWVEAVNGSQVTIEECNYSHTGTYNERTVAASTCQYIHVNDLRTDFTGDGKADLMYMDPNSTTMRLLVSSGSSFSGSVFASGVGQPQWEAAGDFNGDGRTPTSSTKTAPRRTSEYSPPAEAKHPGNSIWASGMAMSAWRVAG